MLLRSYGIVSLMLFTLFNISCDRNANSLDDSKLSSNHQYYDVIISQCAVPQGNGGNWGATFGWLSETILKRYEEAIALQNQGKRVGLFLNCMAGGSSGSVATNVLMNILHNPHIVSKTSQQDVMTPEEAKRVADAVRFIGMSADLNQFELLNFWRQVILESVEGKITGGL